MEAKQSKGTSPDPPYGSRLSCHDGHRLFGLSQRSQAALNSHLRPWLRLCLGLSRISPKNYAKVETKYRGARSTIHLNLSLLKGPLPLMVGNSKAAPWVPLDLPARLYQLISTCASSYGSLSTCTFGQCTFVRRTWHNDSGVSWRRWRTWRR